MTDIEKFFDNTIKNIEEDKQTIYDTHWRYEPPTWDSFLTSGDYITPVKLSPKQMEASVSILGTDPKKIFSPERIVALGVFVVGKGGGKDWLVSIIMCYVILVLLHLKNPQRFLEIDGTLDLLNIGIKGDQGQRVFFNYFKNRIKDCKWFTDNFKIVDENRIVNHPRNKPLGTIELTKGSAIFPNNIRCFSETSKNESWDGYNVIFFVLDEISGFISEKQISNGWKIYETANSSCISRRTKNFKGLGFVISYPRQEKNDIILDLYEMSKISGNEFIYGMRCFSWHFKLSTKYSGETFIFNNPRINRALGLPEDKKFGIEIPIEYKDEFLTNPESSLTKYCALPPRASGNWIEYPDRILASIDIAQKPLFYTQDYVITKIVDGIEYNFLAKKIISCNEPDIDVRRNYRYVAWLDNAEVSCDAVIGIGRKETIKTIGENGVETVIDIVRIVDIINWTPEPNLPIDLENVENFLTTIIPKYINLKEVGKDRWECLRAGTMIQTDKGLISIEDIKGNENVSTKEGINKVIGKVNESGNKKIFKIITKKGYTIECSDNHPFWNGNNWIELKNLKVGDSLCLKASNIFPKEDDISNDRAILYGYLTSEGYLNERNNLFSFTNSDKEVINEYLKLLKNEFNIIGNPELKKYSEEKNIKRKDCWTIRKSDKDIFKIFKNENLIGNSYTKEIPNSIIKGSEKIICSYLSALFEGDGCILGKHYLNKRNNKMCFDNKIQLESASEKLIHQVQLLLLNLKIISNVKKYDYKLGSCYRLTISGNCINTYSEKIGFRSSVKKNKLKDIIFKRTNMRFSINHFKKEFFIDKIKSIECIGNEMTYDIEVSNSHSFIANGFVVHNSALLHNKLIKKGINSIRYNLLGTQYEIAKYFFYLGAVRTFDEEKFVNKNNKELTGLEQMLALISTANGPEKKPDLKKDKSDAYVGVINLLMGQEFNKSNRPKSQKTNMLGNPVLGLNSPYKQTEGYSPVSSQKSVSNSNDYSEEKKKLGSPKLV